MRRAMDRWRCACLAVVGLVSVGCARGPAVSADGLALRRVVVYRNGVGYFERQGHVADDKVDFKVRGREVGDFLATLAVIERGGSSVRAASFPIHFPDDDPGAKSAANPDPPRDAGARADKLETVVLELDGKEHDLQVGYISETPVWRPSYRLIVRPAGADLQEWGIVQNVSGEDWKDVTLSLIAGAPLAFHASLGTPVIPDRPTVSDEGEVIAAVPSSETSLNQAGAAALEGSAPAEPAEQEVDESRVEPAPASAAGAGAVARDRASGAARPARKSAPSVAAVARSPLQPPPPSPPANPSGPRNLAALAGVAVDEGSTRYDIPEPVTVPDKSATMVMLLSKQVPGESIYLFGADPGVPDSATHPFRVVRFSNRTGGLLERGPIAVFEDGAFLGQGMVDSLPDGATATVPFALERGLAVEQSRDALEEGARIGKIEGGQLTIERDAVTRTKYRVRNGGDKAAKVLVKHPRAQSTLLSDPPIGTEDNVGTGSALVPVNVGPRATADLVVAERRIVRREVDWTSPFADDAVRAYFGDRKADPAIVSKLKAAWDIRAVLVRVNNDRAKLAAEKRELENATEQTRENVRALEKNRVAGDLRNQLIERLAKDSLRLESITKEAIELDQQLAEARVRFLDIVRSIKLTMPPQSGS